MTAPDKTDLTILKERAKSLTNALLVAQRKATELRAWKTVEYIEGALAMVGPDMAVRVVEDYSASVDHNDTMTEGQR